MYLSRHLLGSVLATLLASYIPATVAELLPGELNLDLVFPLNDTYAPVDGSLPIVFALSLDPFQPDLVSALGLYVSYDLVDLNNESLNLGEGEFDLVSALNSTNDNPYYFFNYSNTLLSGRESQFQLQITVSFTMTYEGASFLYLANQNVVLYNYFTTQTGAQEAVPVFDENDNTTTTCQSPASRRYSLDINGYIQGLATLESRYPWSSWNSTKCGVGIDAATAANITESTSSTLVTASSSSSSVAAANTESSSSGSGKVLADLSLLVVGLSAVLFFW